MKHLYALLLLLLPVCLLAMPWRGYIVSKNDVPLTGYIGLIQHHNKTSTIVFVNDFGDTYEIAAQLIKGFAYQSDDRMIYYETKRVGQRWRFLQIVAKNEPMELYLLTATYRPQSLEDWSSIAQDGTSAIIAYWLKPEGRRLVKINRWGFRSKMRRLLAPKAPALADKVGQKGYRFRDVPSIIKEYNQLLAPKPNQI
ncbi:MAG TPA: hypothetical protein VJ933_03655 [Phaeodactylibacter sp.]|nr:hypothetical protein [Phaeodactylibacter sp.]